MMDLEAIGAPTPVDVVEAVSLGEKVLERAVDGSGC
jgi:hypothetical protein